MLNTPWGIVTIPCICSLLPKEKKKKDFVTRIVQANNKTLSLLKDASRSLLATS